MIRKLLLSGIFLLIPFSIVCAQTGSLTGTVTDNETGDVIPGVNVLILDLERGDATDPDGVYSIQNIPLGTYSVRFSFIGYTPVSEIVNIARGQNTLNVSLSLNSFTLSDVVVTAMGFERSERSLGYSTQEVSGDVLANSQEVNMVNALAGRTAGVQINSSSGQPGASSRIIIRGNSSLLGDNQPLFVVDGIPISNASDDNIEGPSVFTGGTSNRGLDLDPSNIASMSVLKGASATALYGSRAANGAIIITTKSGQTNQAPIITYNSSVGWADAYTDGYQSDYLGGINGYYYNGLPSARGGYSNDPNANGATQTTRSWGPHKDEVPQEVLNDLGVDKIDTFDPREQFYQTGMTFKNAISLRGGTDNTTYYASIGNTNQDGIVPGTELEKTNVMARFGTSLSEDLNVETSLHYINTSNLWMSEGNGAQSYLYGLNFTPINFDLSQPATFEDGTQRNYTTAFNNPFWLSENNGFRSNVARFIVNGNITYNILPWLSVSERIGIDTYTDQRKGETNIGTRGVPNGSMYDQVINRSEINSDLTFNANFDLSQDINLEMMVGNNINVRDFSSEEIIGTGLNIPGFFHISNANSTVPNEDIEEQRIVSLFSSATVGYKDIVYLTLTGRNDWSSTLPSDNNSYFYGSASLGFVFTDAFDFFQDSFLSYGKLRASLSQIGNDAPVYSLATNFTQANPQDGVRGEINYPFNGVNGYRLSTSLGNPDLKPEITTEYEFGIDLRPLEGRVRLDAAYYSRSTVDQIFNIPTSSATGYTSRLTNAGELKNYGVELTAGVSLIQSSEFQWDVDINFSKNTTEVVEFAPGVENIFLGGFTSPQIRIEDTKNGYGVIWGVQYQRNDDGQLMIGEDGLPLESSELGPIGNVSPDWTGNLRTTFSYRGIGLSALLDKRQGGDILNFDQFYSTFYGTHKVTADRGSTYVFDGVNAETGEPNDIEIVRDQAFYQGHYSNVDENFVEDGSFLKLRELSLSYTLPQSILGQLPIRSLTVTGTGRNLWIDSDFSYKDPEGSLLGADNAQGFYHGVTPGTRSFVVSLNVSF